MLLLEVQLWIMVFYFLNIPISKEVQLVELDNETCFLANEVRVDVGRTKGKYSVSLVKFEAGGQEGHRDLL